MSDAPKKIFVECEDFDLYGYGLWSNEEDEGDVAYVRKDLYDKIREACVYLMDQLETFHGWDFETQQAFDFAHAALANEGEYDE